MFVYMVWVLMLGDCVVEGIVLCFDCEGCLVVVVDGVEYVILVGDVVYVCLVGS